MKYSDKIYDTEILPVDEESLAAAREYLLKGELVAFPTETVYGLGALATDDEAIRRIFEAKGRPSDNPLIVHIHKDYDADSLVYKKYDYIDELRKAFLPGPLTMVYESRGIVSKVATCGLDTVGIRVPSDENAQRFLKAVGVPVAAPSANASKHTSPVTAMHVYEDMKGKIPLILDGGKCRGGIESTVLDVTTDTPIILRSGLVTAEMIVEKVGKCGRSSNKEGERARAPGMKYGHYIPKCETRMFRRYEIKEAQEFYDECEAAGKRAVFMCDGELQGKLRGKKLLLGSTAEEIASNLYYRLHEAESVADMLVSFEIETGSDLDEGIMNRMNKAFKRG